MGRVVVKARVPESDDVETRRGRRRLEDSRAAVDERGMGEGGGKGDDEVAVRDHGGGRGKVACPRDDPSFEAQSRQFVIHHPVLSVRQTHQSVGKDGESFRRERRVEAGMIAPDDANEAIARRNTLMEKRVVGLFGGGGDGQVQPAVRHALPRVGTERGGVQRRAGRRGGQTTEKGGKKRGGVMVG